MTNLSKVKTEYLTIVMKKRADFDQQVTAFLANGWELYGNPYTIHLNKMNNMTDPQFAQALIRKTESK